MAEKRGLESIGAGEEEEERRGPESIEAERKEEDEEEKRGLKPTVGEELDNPAPCFQPTCRSCASNLETRPSLVLGIVLVLGNVPLPRADRAEHQNSHRLPQVTNCHSTLVQA